jgi:hypothetical protein
MAAWTHVYTSGRARWYSPTLCAGLKHPFLDPNINVWRHTLYLAIREHNEQYVSAFGRFF